MWWQNKISTCAIQVVQNTKTKIKHSLMQIHKNNTNINFQLISSQRTKKFEIRTLFGYHGIAKCWPYCISYDITHINFAISKEAIFE